MRWLLALLLTTPLASTAAESQFYGEIQLGVHGIQHSDLDFYPGFVSASAGVYVLPNIGIEVFYDRATNTGKEGNFEIEVNEASGIAAYVLLGYVPYSINQYENLIGSRRLDKENFAGARISFGLAATLPRYKQVQLVAEYRNYDIDAPINVDGFGLGLRVNLR